MQNSGKDGDQRGMGRSVNIYIVRGRGLDFFIAQAGILVDREGTNLFVMD